MEIQKLSHASVLELLPDRHPEAHKGDFGKILLLCGSEGFTGAAALAAMGALRSGAGLVYLGVPRSIYAIEAVKLNEAIVFPLPEEDGKLIALVYFDTTALEEAYDEFKHKMAVSKEQVALKMEEIKREVLEYVNSKVNRFSKITKVVDNEGEFEKTPTKKIRRFLYTKRGQQDQQKK